MSDRKVRARRYSFQAARNENRQVTATAGRERGNMMRVNIWIWLQPSTLAASSSSLGMVSKKPFISQTQSGNAVTE